MESSYSDEAIVEKVRAGERALFEVLMRRNNQRVYRAVRGILRDEAEIEDVMQAAYVSAFVHLDSFQRSSLFSTWLVRIAINEAISRLRRRSKLIAVGDPFDGDDTTTEASEIIDLETAREQRTRSRVETIADPERQAASRELVRILERVVDELPEQSRTAFLLREVEGMSTSEAAECLQITEGALKVRLHRAKSSIRDALMEQLGEAAEDAFRFEAPRCDRVVAAVFARLTTE